MDKQVAREVFYFSIETHFLCITLCMQSLLRLRLLQRGVAAQDQCSQKSAVSEVNRQPQGSAIMQLRYDNFSSNVIDKTLGWNCYEKIPNSSFCLIFYL